MRYALLICDDGSDDRSPEQITEDPGHVAWLDLLDRRGVTLLTGARLRSISDATHVRVRGDEQLISDGPFAETKEQIGGIALIDCADLDVAIEAAAYHPWARHGVIEVRPVWDDGD